MEGSRRFTFKKSERLRSKKLISEIFENGFLFYTPMFRVSWITLQAGSTLPAQAAFSVPKKNIRSAVVRNLVKRRIREAYRRNKYILYDFLNSEKISTAFFVIFRDTSPIDYCQMEESVIEILKILCKQIKQKQSSLVKEK